MFRDDLAAASARIEALERDLAQATRERDKATAELDRLRLLLAAHGIGDDGSRPGAPPSSGTQRDLVYCGSCGGANGLGQTRCEHCDELLGDHVIADARDDSCPACGAGRLEQVDLGALQQLSSCRRCGGIWLTARTVPKLLGAAADHALGFEPKELDMFWDGQLRPVRPSYLRCPDCRQMMLRRAHAEARVVVDVCSAHGIWLDHGELPQLLAAAEQSGTVSNPLTLGPPTGGGAGWLGGPSRSEAVLDWLGNLLVTKVRHRSIW